MPTSIRRVAFGLLLLTGSALSLCAAYLTPWLYERESIGAGAAVSIGFDLRQIADMPGSTHTAFVLALWSMITGAVLLAASGITALSHRGGRVLGVARLVAAIGLFATSVANGIADLRIGFQSHPHVTYPFGAGPWLGVIALTLTLLGCVLPSRRRSKDVP
jgi:hypothetical protein